MSKVSKKGALHSLKNYSEINPVIPILFIEGQLLRFYCEDLINFSQLSLWRDFP